MNKFDDILESYIALLGTAFYSTLEFFGNLLGIENVSEHSTLILIGLAGVAIFAILFAKIFRFILILGCGLATFAICQHFFNFS